jgi:hypothetical protein
MLFFDANLQRVSLQVEVETAKSRPLVRLEPLRAKASVNGFSSAMHSMKNRDMSRARRSFRQPMPFKSPPQA